MGKKQLPENEMLIYQTPDGGVSIAVFLEKDNLWLSQRKMAELFGCSTDNISQHLKNIYNDKELDES